ncbi:ribosomal-processing cysteine protease Prp [Ornithinibacillus gellani]|uniref:ribosomal-processing cysteine protease Prp n=1 Tax=Ornithinibacillus gellani TaxID=2293253 RepID=UPI000F4638D8|nr:ribosomal-processing cysteine protease Prp [Ornithinibacillus gellani]TQS74679.1 ribosomal-processing cysteine protease Prp [Ornithinibacillus gellani]
MIKVEVRYNGRYVEAFEISGHAKSGPYGYDLVCAAVSAVSFGAVNAVAELCQFTPIIQQGREGGYLSVEIPSQVDDHIKDKASLLLEGMVISLETIEREYNRFIQIRKK